MILRKVRHVKRYTAKTLVDSAIDYTSATCHKGQITCAARVSITETSPNATVHEGYEIMLTEAELRRMLKHIETYTKHFNDDGSVK